jgi:hypothetical protein
MMDTRGIELQLGVINHNLNLIYHTIAAGSPGESCAYYVGGSTASERTCEAGPFPTIQAALAYKPQDGVSATVHIHRVKFVRTSSLTYRWNAREGKWE